jgi:hypothetical protein
MTNYFVFNGDADGICAAQQLLLSERIKDLKLITGVKRDISLLKQIETVHDTNITVLDIAVEKNRQSLQMLLDQGCHVRYFDHHVSSDRVDHPNFDGHIDTTASINTSFLVFKTLKYFDPSWAIAGLFGDNMQPAAETLAKEFHIDSRMLGQLKELGELLNYNAYGDSTADLYFNPADLLETVIPFADPVDFIRETSVVATLRKGQAADLAQAEFAEELSPGIIRFPDKKWARRVIGIYANKIAREEPDKAHAVLVTKPGGKDFVVSVRSPLNSRKSAVELCCRFPTGGGRVKAAGINHLPVNMVSDFVEKFNAHYG